MNTKNNAVRRYDVLILWLYRADNVTKTWSGTNGTRST